MQFTAINEFREGIVTGIAFAVEEWVCRDTDQPACGNDLLTDANAHRGIGPAAGSTQNLGCRQVQKAAPFLVRAARPIRPAATALVRAHWERVWAADM